ncbi:DUF4262 domain-containing protein [Gordonia hydrophobica]|uniref:DUF4262 domain-containing protein n=1 Tax=Gordonia hydrophobica TaxID=40516 RepID=A0ABZ2TYE9_9ACTN|nr:DUF4262 domain-containing protein [Gordonia hydrophobica]MBM7366991.1 hypothetical protein [Gordonia hydrophobica]
MCEFDPECDGADDLIGDALAQITDGRWAVTGVLGDAAHPPIAYTSGLTEHGRPELVMTGLPPRLAGLLLDYAAQAVVGDPTFGAGSSVPARLRRPVSLHAIDVIDADPLRLTRVLYGLRFNAVQLVWPDDEGRYPWEPRYAIPAQVQPLLGVPAVEAA